MVNRSHNICYCIGRTSSQLIMAYKDTRHNNNNNQSSLFIHGMNGLKNGRHDPFTRDITRGFSSMVILIRSADILPYRRSTKSMYVVVQTTKTTTTTTTTSTVQIMNYKKTRKKRESVIISL